MKILFVYRGYGEKGVNSVIDFQRNSLVKAGVEIDNFLISGGGVKNYIKAIFQLRKYLKENKVDVLHAHYSFSGYIAGLAIRKPVVCSLMGSDILQLNSVLKFTTRFFYRFIWNVTIVKSAEMKRLFPKALVIPNGVDFSNFKPVDRDEAFKKTGFPPDRRNIIFVAENPQAVIKNVKLAQEGVQLLEDETVSLHLVSGKTFADLPYFYSAADVLLLTSLSEGSPNVIKEAMACNCPVVSTDVGDVSTVIGNTEGCFVVKFDPKDVASKLRKALDFNKRTNGRDAIARYDTRLIAEKIIATYKGLIK